MKKIKRRAGRAGITLIETTVVMIVASAALAVGAGMYSDYLNNLTNRAAANQMKEVTDAFSRYMDDNHMMLRALVPGVGARTTVSFSDLQSGGYLPAAFENRTPFNHEYVLTVRRQGAGNVLQGLVHTSYSDASFAIEPKHALEISRMVGVSGGYTGDIDPQDVISTYGNYDLDLATFGLNPGPGVLVSAVAVEHTTKPGEKYLHRSETGDPDHNRMNTHIDMDNNNLNNVHTVSTRSLYASELVDGQRIRADVGDITTLTASLGEINTVNAETITTSSATVTGDQTVGGTLDVAGRITASDHITLTRVVTEGEVCGPDVDNGTVARDNAGMLLSCQDGKWKGSEGGIGYGQTWQIPPRSFGVVYTNQTGKPIMVAARARGISNETAYIVANVNGVSFLICADNSTYRPDCAGSFIVPAGSSYSLTSNTAKAGWAELR